MIKDLFSFPILGKCIAIYLTPLRYSSRAGPLSLGAPGKYWKYIFGPLDSLCERTQEALLCHCPGLWKTKSHRFFDIEDQSSYKVIYSFCSSSEVPLPASVSLPFDNIIKLGIGHSLQNQKFRIILNSSVNLNNI